MVDAGLISEQQLEEALSFQEKQGGKIAEALIALGFIEAEQFVRFLAKQPGVASIDLTSYEVPKEIIDLVPRDLAVQHEVFPIDKLGKLLTLGMVCPLDGRTIGEIEDRTGLKVKPLLCSPMDVRDSIRRYYPAVEGEAEPVEVWRPDEEFMKRPIGRGQASELPPASTMRLHSLIPMLRSLRSLPTLPETVKRVEDAIHDPEIALAEVGRIIEQDPPVAAKVLSVANSAAYGFPNRVGRIELAVSLLGLRETSAIVMGAAVVNMFEQGKVLDYPALWRQSMRTAGAIRQIAKRTGYQGETSRLLPIGLLLSIGRIALAEVAPERYGKVNHSLTGRGLTASEEEVCAIAHPEAGYELTQHWGLPEEICVAIRFHEKPEMANGHRQLCAIASLAKALGYSSSGDAVEDIFRDYGEAVAMLEVDEDVLSEMVADYREKVAEEVV